MGLALSYIIIIIIITSIIMIINIIIVTLLSLLLLLLLFFFLLLLVSLILSASYFISFPVLCPIPGVDHVGARGCAANSPLLAGQQLRPGAQDHGGGQ